ncbi:hypothetical protein HF888_14385 [Bermanella marisrubri]|uniref:Uncharacterized protein n=1 Tax=Bermanella marisrubri TaxID=207949 RepID=Q1MY66_9GAMM|nr:hypothetical protein [Bermanella marisrubri]EAT10894.1 hypothetical protein RED65_12625 [Oceanobacter sp. RED65] [Bermanella marisrubri]QIZ85338.1 hypothetical protein HF888_14385 [Bermanella marisrubri]
MQIIKVVCLSWLLVVLQACSPISMQPEQAQQANVLAQLPDWYHQSLGYQVYGGNNYTQQPPALARLMQEADAAFMRGDYDQCQILLERAQRINSQNASVYIRLSMLAWLQNNAQLAIQMARRALVFVGDDVQARQEVERLIQTIEDRTYTL